MGNQDTQTTLYNGLHSVTFKNGTHRYYVDGSTKQGVTTIMGKVLAKPGLMLWPLNEAMKYIRKNSEQRVASLYLYVTEEVLKKAEQAHITKRDKGADTGTIVHELVERYLSGESITPVDTGGSLEVAAALVGFIKWHRTSKPKTIAVEQIVYSHARDYAGTFDSILEINGKVYLCDLKTTNASRDAPQGVYADYFIQLGAYLYAYEEQRQYELAHGGTKLVQIDDLMIISCKKDGKVDTLTASQVGIKPETAMKMWSNTLFLHNSLLGVKNKIMGERNGSNRSTLHQ